MNKIFSPHTGLTSQRKDVCAAAGGTVATPLSLTNYPTSHRHKHHDVIAQQWILWTPLSDSTWKSDNDFWQQAASSFLEREATPFGLRFLH